MEGFISFASEYRQYIGILHVLGVILGVGGATVADILFFRFLKKFRISGEEVKILNTITGIIWTGIVILLITGFALYLPRAEILNDSPKFLVKMIVVGVIILNGSLMNIFATPRLERISFGQPHLHRRGELHFERKIIFAMGSISASSWYTAFFLGSIRTSYGLSFGQLLSIYIGILAIAITSSQIYEHLIERRSRRN